MKKHPPPKKPNVTSRIEDRYPRVARWLRLDRLLSALLSLAHDQAALLRKKFAGAVNAASQDALRRRRRYLPQLEGVENRILPSTFQFVSNDPHVYEHQGPLSIEIERTSSKQSETAYVRIQDDTAVYGQDYWIEEGEKGGPIEKISDQEVQVHFAEGVSSVTLTIGIVNDESGEDNEQFSMTLSDSPIRGFSQLEAGNEQFELGLSGSLQLGFSQIKTDLVQSTVTIGDNDTLSVQFVVTQGAVTAGEAFDFTVTAIDEFGNTAVGYSGTVRFDSSDERAELPATV